MLIVSPEPMPEKRPWSTSTTGAPMMVALPVNWLMSRRVVVPRPVARRFRLPLSCPAKSRLLPS